MAVASFSAGLAAGCRSETPPPRPVATASPRVATAWRPAEATLPVPHETVAADDPARAVRDVPPTVLSQGDARRLVEHVVKDRLGRELGAQDSERLADAVIRLRAAAQALRRSDDSSTRERQGSALRDAFAEIEAITGVPASDLGLLDKNDPAPDPAGAP